MLYIEKNECPGEVADDIQAIKETDAWKNTPEPLNQVLPEERSKTTRELRNFFDQLKKDKIREALLIEQHYLCAYCMSSIENNPLHTTIEHWLPLSKSKETALDYQNFLATCKGGSDIDAMLVIRCSYSQLYDFFVYFNCAPGFGFWLKVTSIVALHRPPASSKVAHLAFL